MMHLALSFSIIWTGQFTLSTVAAHFIGGPWSLHLHEMEFQDQIGDFTIGCVI
jgi:hypothetical protein